MKSVQEWLAGKKTYLVGISAILAAVIAWVSGEVELPAMVATITAAIMGMTMRAGVAKGEVRRAILPFAVGSLLLIGGCTGMSNGQKYIIAAQAYTTTANTVATLVRAGEFGAADKARIRLLNDVSKDILLKMRGDLVAGKTMDFPYALSQFQTVIDELLRMQLTAQAASNRKETASNGPDNPNPSGLDCGAKYGVVAGKGNRGVPANRAHSNPGRNRGCHPSGIGGPCQPRRRTEWRPAYPAIASGKPEVEWD